MSNPKLFDTIDELYEEFKKEKKSKKTPSNGTKKMLSDVPVGGERKVWVEIRKKIYEKFAEISELCPNCVLGFQSIYDDDGNVIMCGGTIVSSRKAPKNMLGVEVEVDVDEDGVPTPQEQGKIALSILSMALINIVKDKEYDLSVGLSIGMILDILSNAFNPRNLRNVLKRNPQALDNAKKNLSSKDYKSLLAKYDITESEADAWIASI